MKERGERGSVTPLIIGFAVVVALLVAVVVDASAAYLRRQGLNSAADSAALAATDGIQGEEVYTHGLGKRADIDQVRPAGTSPPTSRPVESVDGSPASTTRSRPRPTRWWCEWSRRWICPCGCLASGRTYPSEVRPLRSSSCPIEGQTGRSPACAPPALMVVSILLEADPLVAVSTLDQDGALGDDPDPPSDGGVSLGHVLRTDDGALLVERSVLGHVINGATQALRAPSKTNVDATTG